MCDDSLRRHDCLDRPLVTVQACNHRSVKRDGRERWRPHNSDDKSWPVERPPRVDAQFDAWCALLAPAQSLPAMSPAERRSGAM